MSPGAESFEICWMPRSSISAGMVSKARPALVSSICRVRLCDASTSGLFPCQIVMFQVSCFKCHGSGFIREPRALPVGVKLQDRSRRFLDRPPRHVELRPVEFRAQLFCKSDFVGNRLAIDVIFVARGGTDAQEPV